MSNLIDYIYKYFSDKSITTSSKFKILLLVCITLFFIEDHYQLIRMYSDSYRVDYIEKLHEAKQRYANDSLFVAELDNSLHQIHTHKSSVRRFFTILNFKVTDEQKIKSGMIYEKLVTEREPLINTISGALIPLLFTCSAFLYILILIFKKNIIINFDNLFFALCCVIIGGIITYYVSLAWVLVPPIFGHVWINYIVQLCVSWVVLSIMVSYLDAWGLGKDNETNNN